MRWLLPILIAAAACSEDRVRPSLEGPYVCGPKTCETGEVCLTLESGSQCGVDPEHGIGQYQPYDWSCVPLPAECDGVPDCDCLAYGAICFGPLGDGREVSFGCI
jgi:hypothetical protein